jgi:YfiH family protein
MTAQLLSDRSLAAARGVAHGFFTRRGGVSRGLYESLNCGLGSADEAALVAENRARALAALGLEAGVLVTGYQVHGAEAVTVEGAEPWTPGEGPRADALVTSAPGVALGVLTADCAPVLLAEPHAGVVGAAHAGWRGALAGVLEAVVAAMERLGATRGSIRAAVGPCIAEASYEVGPEFSAPFLARAEADRRFFTRGPRERRWRFDLAAYVADRLRSLGLAEVAASGHDTYAEAELFFSHRRARHRGEPDYGRCLAAIALVP